MNKKKYVKPRCININPKTVKDPKLLEAIHKLQQMAQEQRNSGETREYFIEIDPAVVKDPQDGEAIRELQQVAQETRDGREAVKRSRLLLKLNRPRPD